MRSFKNSLIALLIFSGAGLFAQGSDILNQSPLGKQNGRVQQNLPDPSSYMFGDIKPDFKIIASNSSYIELEFYPSNVTSGTFESNGEQFNEYAFLNAGDFGLNKTGDPDLKFRSFPVYLPSANNNTAQVIDFDMKEVPNVNIAPVPSVKFYDPNSRSFENAYYVYTKSGAYAQNKYFPESPAQLVNIGPLRDALVGNLLLYPFQYNPVTKNLRYYSRIKVRITFGESPVQLNRPRNRQEINLLRGSAINFDAAANWMNPALRNSVKNRMVINSVLNSGDWYKIEIKDNNDGNSEGIYKITKSFLDNAGINVNGLDPRTIKIYGNSGELLGETMNLPRPEDLVENAIYIEGENDGVFNNDDYILFYGKSVNPWHYDSTSNSFYHTVNYYSRSNYYWICINTAGNGKRMQLVQSENTSNPYVPSSFTEKLYTEPDEENLISEGNLWLSFSKRPGQSFEWNATLNGLESGSDILYRIKLAQRVMCNNAGYFQVKDDYSNMSEYPFALDCVVSGFDAWINTRTASFTVNQSQKTNGEQVKLRSTFYANVGEGEGYLDWYEIQYKRRFNSVSGDLARFNSPDTNMTVEYNVSSFSGNSVKVFDATSYSDVKMVQPLDVSSSNVRFQKTEQKNNLSRYFVVGPGGFKTPTSVSSRVTNQNLHGISDGYDFIIITHKDFVSAAERIKSKREQGGPGNPDYLKTVIVTTEQIYNEFSGGVYDAVAIRDFVKYAYDNWNTRPTFVCLLGDGGFDYKNIKTQGGNYVPAWEKTDPQIHQVLGLTSDDFYVNITDGSPLIDVPDLAIGRIPANSLVDANNYIDKVDAYESGTYNGYWKNKMLFVADDEKTTAPGCEGIFHLTQCESTAEQFTPPFIDKVKIYLATYPTVITPQGRRKPQVNADIAKNWSDGVLNIHWTGHGSPDVWAHEYVLEKDNILSLINNTNRYPFVTIASCDMSKFDNPSNTSAGELFMMANRKGAIGTMAASRPVYASGNAVLFYAVFGNLYMPRDTLLLQQRFGTAIFNAKNQLSPYSENDAKFILMCDPTIRVQMPRFKSVVDSISGLSGDTMKALSKIKIFGSVVKPDNTVWSDYNGSLILKIYDVDRTVQTQEDCNPPLIQNFRLNGGIIYSGTKTIQNGKWSVEFIVPKDISYQNQPGRLINYFYNTQYDGAGINRDFIVGGINPNADVDSTGPRISMFMNSRNFRSGDVVNENSKLIADLFDESGINTTGTLGHKLEGILDGNENNKYDFTNYYNSDTTYKSGTIEFDFSGLSVGRHSLKLKAWDTYNNSSEALIEFDVASTGTLQVTNIYNYPNPFAGNTAFTFQHNYPANINVKIKVYTVAGRLIKEIEQKDITDKFVVINWDGKDQDGETLGNGVYIYRIVVESADGLSVTNTGKLAVLK